MAAMAAATAPSFHSKRPSQKKRHTKPCRYYQIGACPHKAQDDCDFAHVFSEQPPSVPAPQGKQCRYYLQGNCTSGIWCRYKHGDDNTEDAAILEEYRNMNLLSGHEFGLASPLQMHVPPPATMCIPSGFSGYMAPGPWSPLEYAPPHLSPPRAVISPTASLDWSSTEYPSPSSSPTSSVSDDGVLIPADDAVTAAPHGSYFGVYPGSIRYLGVPYASDDPRYSHAPVPLRVHIPSYGMAPLYEIFSPKGPPTAGFFPGAPQSPMQKSINPQKPVSYRTKPCRFFKPGSVCPNGEACTFIHSDPKSNDSISTSSPKSSKLQHELPVKPLSKQEEETRKGFFPISWRVIGGGVMLSGAYLHVLRAGANVGVVRYQGITPSRIRTNPTLTFPKVRSTRAMTD
ncbi:hypothetical protein GGX14DRAFT_444248 [Mycena pura]|uniref:C3H1-type domain-containing protein n=1 Tax=Mycena pura TaxID=153505 RepID=A0AAD6YFA5_9AGAR|nr:hypothetical protein GGX14DRAFT_444248 [Mycena pura]